MTVQDINHYRKVLETSAAELGSATRHRDTIHIEGSGDEIDRVIQAGQREFAVRRLEAGSARLRDTQAALRRIEDGSYGICVECEEPISPRRLAALPSAALCIRCQAEADCRCAARTERFSWPLAA